MSRNKCQSITNAFSLAVEILYFHYHSTLSQSLFLLYSKLPALSSAKRKQKTAKNKFQHNSNEFYYVVTDKTLIFQLFLRPRKAWENSNTLLQVWASLCLFARNHLDCELRHTKMRSLPSVFLSTNPLFFSFPSKLNCFCHRLFPSHRFFTLVYQYRWVFPKLRVVLLTQITSWKYCSTCCHFTVFEKNEQRNRI